MVEFRDEDGATPGWEEDTEDVANDADCTEE